MGLIERVFTLVFGSGRNVLQDTVEVFRPNAEAQAHREHERHSAALQQFAQEFHAPRRGWFDRFMDALNRIPRPAMALGTLGLFVAAMTDPVWFSERMAGMALVPEPLWWLLGAIVSFYFGARHQTKGQEFQREIAARLAQQVHIPKAENPDPKPAADEASSPIEDNAALEEWRRLSRQTN